MSQLTRSQVDADHRRSQQARQSVRVVALTRRAQRAATEAEQADLDHVQHYNDVLTRLLVQARARVAQIQAHQVEALNAARQWHGQPQLHRLPDDLPDRLVARAVAGPAFEQAV